MSGLGAALTTELLKARRSRVPLLTAAGFALAPFMGGFFMIILRDPERARALGLISSKAQLAAGSADWPSFLALLAQATAVGGALLFALVSAWVFGREYADHTAKEWLATPTPRAAVITAKFLVVLAWTLALTLVVLAFGLVIGAVIGLPQWSAELLRRGVVQVVVSALLATALMPPVAFVASVGRGYLPPLGWAMLTLFLAQIVAATGWGAWFPWSVPPLYSGLAGAAGRDLEWYSYALVGMVCIGGIAATIAWWQHADHR